MLAEWQRTNSRKLHLNKHVSRACDACRRKRCKCDGQVPCFMCHSTGDPCTYSHDDRRQQRRKQNTVRRTGEQQTVVQNAVTTAHDCYEPSPTDSLRYNASIDDPFDMSKDFDVDDTMHDSGIGSLNSTPSIWTDVKDSNTETGINLNPRKLQSLAILQPKPSYSAENNLTQNTQTQTTILSHKSSKDSSKDLESKIPVMKDMQGKFSTRKSMLSHNSDSERYHSSYRRVLPKSGSSPKYNQSGNHRRPLQFSWQLQRKSYAVPGYTRAFGNLPFSSAIGANGYPVDIQSRQSFNFLAPEHLVFPIVDIDNSPLTRTYTDFQRLVQRLVAEGRPISQIADQGLIDVTLYFRDREPEDPVNASTWASEMLRAFRGTFSDKLLLACAVCVGSLMRWLLIPSAENYANMPAIARPTSLQRLKPHPAWVDLMVFPSFRNALINNLREWAEPCLRAGWELLWPRSLEETLLHDTDTQRVFLTPEFVAYVVNTKHWIMRKSILIDFPEIEGSEINISQ